jgi:hypothetical protein
MTSTETTQQVDASQDEAVSTYVPRHAWNDGSADNAVAEAADPADYVSMADGHRPRWRPRKSA